MPRYRLTLTCDVRCHDLEDADVQEYVRFFGATHEELSAAAESALRQRELLGALLAEPSALEAFLAHALPEPVAERVGDDLARGLGAEDGLYFAVRRALERLDDDDQQAFAASEADGLFYDDTELVRRALRVRLVHAALERREGAGAPVAAAPDAAALRACPFCGSDRGRVHAPEVVRGGELGDVDVEAGFVACEGCGACGPSGGATDDVVARWNGRAGGHA